MRCANIVALTALALVTPLSVHGQCASQVSCSLEGKVSTQTVARAIQGAGSLAAAIPAVEAQIEVYERYLRDLQASGDSPQHRRGIALTKEGIACNRQWLEVLRCHEKSSSGSLRSDTSRRGDESYSTELKQHLQGVVTDIQKKLQDLALERQSADESTGRVHHDRWLAEYEVKKKRLDEDLATVSALLRESAGNARSDELDTLFGDIAAGRTNDSEERISPRPTKTSPSHDVPGGSQNIPIETCNITIQGLPGGELVPLGNNPLTKTWGFQIPVIINSECRSEPQLTLQIRYMDGAAAREVLQRPSAGVGFDRGLLVIELPGTAVVRVTSVSTASLSCSCNGKVVSAAQPRQLVYGESQLAEARAGREAHETRALDDEARRESLRCPSVRTLTVLERKQLCDQKTAVWKNVHQAWHRASVQLLEWGGLLETLKEMEAELLLAFQTDRDYARRRVDFANALNKIEAVLSILAPVSAGSSTAKAVTDCIPPLNLSQGVSAVDVKDHLDDLRTVLDLASNPSLPELLHTFAWCVVGEWSPILGKVKDILALVHAGENEEKFNDGMAAYRIEVVSQIATIRAGAASAERRREELKAKMGALYRLMDEVTFCACE